MFKKLIINEWFKEYSVMDVSESCFNASPNIETCGSATAFKIKSDADLNFRLTELNRLGFNAV